MADAYERELKGILGGEGKFLERAETWGAGYSTLRERPFLVVKAGGSFGIDLLAAREFTVLPIEVKASASRVFRFSKNKRLEEQASAMVDACRKAELVAIYAYRLKRVVQDPWHLFVAGDLENSFTRMMPHMEPGSRGNVIMRWEEGLPLGEFLNGL